MTTSGSVARRGACCTAAPARSRLGRRAPGRRGGQLQRSPRWAGHAALHAAGRPPAPHVPVPAQAAGRTTSSDGVTVQLTRSGGRWLISRLLFY
jgi:hypothetical protein